jgi:hypothetical protein
MNRYLIVTVGYQYMAIPIADGIQAASLLAGLVDAVIVESKGYGDEQRWVPVKKEPVAIQFANADRVTVGDEVDSLRALLKEAEVQAASYSKYWQSEQATVKKLKEQIASKPAQNSPAPPIEPPPDPVEIPF